MSRIEELVRKAHKAKGRYHTQLAMCDLYDACGLPNFRPGSEPVQPDNTAKLYEELRSIIDGGSESFTHNDAVQYLKDNLAPLKWTPEDAAHRPGGLAQPEQLQWTDAEGVQYTFPLEGATQLLADLYAEWPGGLAEIESAMRTRSVQPEQEPWLLESTQTLAKNLAREFYPEVTQWECLNDLAGVISQIDNMTTGLIRKPEPVTQDVPRIPQEHSSKPVGRFAQFSDGLWREVTEYSEGVMLYASPPQRLALTDAEIDEIVDAHTSDDGQGYEIWCDGRGVARAIEAKLKEKNI